MNQKHVVRFHLQAVTSLYVGSGDSGSLLKDAMGSPLLLGSSIGGALREYLEQVCEDSDLIIAFMGGDVREGAARNFVESRIYISDGEVESDQLKAGIEKKEGTAVHEATGAARDHHKYKHEYLPAGFALHFQIECEVNAFPADECNYTAENFAKLVGTWASGIHAGRLRFGGKKSNDFGKFRVLSLEQTVFQFDSEEALDDYIFHRKEAKGVQLDFTQLQRFESAPDRIGLSLHGKFPYGVYQSFVDTTLAAKIGNKRVTGPLIDASGRYYIPASSLKGLLRKEFLSLTRRVLADQVVQAADVIDEVAEVVCAELFGSVDQLGRLRVSDMRLDEVESVTVERGDDAEGDQHKLPVYVKIDRLTGGVMPGALKHQHEICGKGVWTMELRSGQGKDADSYLFPLIYILRRIGAGLVPVGGRTVIGLGQFVADDTMVTLADGRSLSVANNSSLHGEARLWLEERYGDFMHKLRHICEEKELLRA